MAMRRSAPAEGTKLSSTTRSSPGVRLAISARWKIGTATTSNFLSQSSDSSSRSTGLTTTPVAFSIMRDIRSRSNTLHSAKAVWALVVAETSACSNIFSILDAAYPAAIARETMRTRSSTIWGSESTRDGCVAVTKVPRRSSVLTSPSAANRLRARLTVEGLESRARARARQEGRREPRGKAPEPRRSRTSM